MKETKKTVGYIGFGNYLKRTVGCLAEKYVFRSQISRKRRQTVQGFSFLTYFSSSDFPSLIQRAANVIEKDERAVEIVRGYLRAVVEIGSAANLSVLGRSGMSIGVYYDQLPSGRVDSELAEVSFACALVQFAVCRKLLLRLSERCPNRYNMQTEKRIKRISVKAMHAFTVRAQLDARYSYEIECKLKNGAFDC